MKLTVEGVTEENKAARGSACGGCEGLRGSGEGLRGVVGGSGLWGSDECVDGLEGSDECVDGLEGSDDCVDGLEGSDECVDGL